MTERSSLFPAAESTQAVCVRSAGRSIPDFLTGQDGDVVFVPRDLTSDTVTRAYERALAEGYNLSDMEVDEVEMLPVPEYFTGLGVEWATVREGTPGSVRFWRFRA